MRAAWLALIALGACSGKPAAVATPMAAVPPDAAVAPPPITLSRADTWLCDLDRWEDCQERCDAGNALSCMRLAQLLQVGWERYPSYGDIQRLEPDPAAAAVALERSCELGYGNACAQLAVTLLDDDGPKDEARGVPLLARACDAELAWACTWLAGVDGQDREALLQRGCTLGDPDACLDAAVIAGDEHGDTDAAMRGMRRALQGAPAASPSAAAQVHCTGDAIARYEAPGLALMGPPNVETYCATADGKREGEYLRWLSDEDLAEGREHGIVVEEGAFHADLRDGHFFERDDHGVVQSEGDYAGGQRNGDWTEWRSESDRSQGTYRADLREGDWTETAGDFTKVTPYVAGKREGVEISSWPEQRCEDHYKDDKADGKSTCWYANGKKLSESTWKNGQMVGTGKRWDKAGKPY